MSDDVMPCEHGSYGLCPQCVREERDRLRAELSRANEQLESARDQHGYLVSAAAFDEVCDERDSLRAELAGKEKALSAAKTVIEAKDKAYALIDQRFAAMSAKAATTDSERECNERLTAEIDALTAELAEARRLLDEARKQEPVAHVHYHKTGGNAGIAWSAIPTGVMPLDGKPLYAAPVPAQHAVPTYAGPCMCARDHCQNRTSMPHPTWKCRKESQPAVPDDVAKDAARYRWMRADSPNAYMVIRESAHLIDEKFDAAIDAAILSTTEGRSNG